MEQNRLFTHKGIRLLRSAIIKELMLKLVAIQSFSLLSLYAAIYYSDQYILALIWGISLGIAGLIWNLILIRDNVFYNKSILHLLQEQPERIVWVYTMQSQFMPFGINSFTATYLYFKFVDGDEMSVMIKTKNAKLISRTLNRVLPHATFGYSSQKAQLYKHALEQLSQKNSLIP